MSLIMLAPKGDQSRPEPCGAPSAGVFMRPATEGGAIWGLILEMEGPPGSCPPLMVRVRETEACRMEMTWHVAQNIPKRTKSRRPGQSSRSLPQSKPPLMVTVGPSVSEFTSMRPHGCESRRGVCGVCLGHPHCAMYRVSFHTCSPCQESIVRPLLY